MFRGTGTALVTPFAEKGVDYKAFQRLIDAQIDSGVQGLIVLGTTGEAPTVTDKERDEIVSFSVSASAGRLPVIVGTGANSTEHTVELSRRACDLGADGVLVVTPYYNKPTQEGLFRHFETVARAVPTPIIVYNVPGRTGCTILPETVARLAEIENVVGIKEASGDLSQVDELIRRLKALRPDFLVYSGNDDQAFHVGCSGGDGVISVLSNVAPRETVSMMNACLAGELAAARDAHMRLFPLMKALFVETNPIPVKYAVFALGLCGPEIRLPLVQASQGTRNRVDSCLADLRLLS